MDAIKTFLKWTFAVLFSLWIAIFIAHFTYHYILTIKAHY